MKTTKSMYRAVFACTIVLFVAACADGVPPQPELTNSQPEAQSTNLAPGAVPIVIASVIPPTPSYPPDWVQFSSESPRYLIYHATGWTVTAEGFHVEFQSPSGYAWAEVDLLSPENPGLAGEPLASGGDITQLAAQLESALKENGSFGEAESLTTIGGGSVWLIEGTHETFGDNVGQETRVDQR